MLKTILLIIAGGTIGMGINILFTNLESFYISINKNKKYKNSVEVVVSYIIFKIYGILMIAIPIILVIIYNK